VHQAATNVVDLKMAFEASLKEVGSTSDAARKTLTKAQRDRVQKTLQAANGNGCRKKGAKQAVSQPTGRGSRQSRRSKIVGPAHGCLRMRLCALILLKGRGIFRSVVTQVIHRR